jgi:hypothetical protein
MKNINFLVRLISILILLNGCTIQQPMTSNTQPSPSARSYTKPVRSQNVEVAQNKVQFVDNFYAKVQDVYLLERGMDYLRVKETLKIDPKEVLFSVNDNCLIAVYDVKSNFRVHKPKKNVRIETRSLTKEIVNTGNDLEIIFYPSKSLVNLTYDINSEAPQVFVIFDGKTQKVRSYFFETDRSSIELYQNMLKRAVLACNDPSKMKELFSK